MCGPEGVGGLYVKAEARERLRPTFISWHSVITDSHGRPAGWYPDGQRYEVATCNYPLYPGLKQAIAIYYLLLITYYLLLITYYLLLTFSFTQSDPRLLGKSGI